MNTSAAFTPTTQPNTQSNALKFIGWVVLLTFWFCFGASTALNGLVFTEIIGDGAFQYPVNTRETAIAIVAIWSSAYVIGILVGLTSNAPQTPIWHYINSVVAGYLLSTVLHIMFIGPFPNTPANSFGVLRDLVSLAPLPIYYIFVLMTLVFGPILAGIATYTGYLIANELLDFKFQSAFTIHANIFIFAFFAPLAIMMFFIGTLNVCNTEEILGIKGFAGLQIGDYCDYDNKQTLTVSYQRLANSVNQSLPFNQQETVPTILIFYLDLLPNPLVNALLALFCGVVIGLKRRLNGIDIAFSAGLGMLTYIAMMLIITSTLKPTTTANINYAPVYNDQLRDLSHPDGIVFLTLWIIPPLVAVASAFATHILINAMLVPKADQ